MQTGQRFHVANVYSRIEGIDPPASQVFAQALEAGNLPIRARAGVPLLDEQDSTLIDPVLRIEEIRGPIPEPSPGVSYAGLTPAQRYAFLRWLDEPTAPAPAAFQQLYIAHLEVRLFQDNDHRKHALHELCRLSHTEPWRENELLARAAILGFWLSGDGNGLAEWLIDTPLNANLMNVALGCQALLQAPLRAEQLPSLLSSWQISAPDLSAEVMRLRLSSLTVALEAEPLAHVLALQPEEGRIWRPWRCAHRHLRIEVPQPEIRPHLEPLLRDMVEVVEVPESAEVSPVQPAGEDDPSALDDLGWRLILEFGHSRSDLYTWILQECQRMPGYMQLMDENRKVVHRVIFKKSEMRRFWRLWQYIQNWASTRVYLNGEEMEKWKIWPYSQYIR